MCSSELHHYISENTGGALLGVILLSYEHDSIEGMYLKRLGVPVVFLYVCLHVCACTLFLPSLPSEG